MGIIEEKRIDVNELLKGKNVQIIPPIKEIRNTDENYIKIGGPILFIPESGLSKHIHYIASRYASKSNLKIEDIAGYQIIEDEKIKELQERHPNEKGYGLQFYINKKDSENILNRYRQSITRIYMM